VVVRLEELKVMARLVRAVRSPDGTPELHAGRRGEKAKEIAWHDKI
jgi:hypothetical protein